MASLKQFGNGEKLNTPSLSKMVVEDLVKTAVEDDNKKMDSNFRERMSYPCGVCKASGIDPDEKVPCFACEGTGKDYEIVYGIEDGVMVAHTEQYGLDFFKEYCKACREAEADMTLTNRANRFMVRAYSLPAVIDMELQARGFTPQEIRGGSGESKKIAKVIQKEWPELMTTNYRF